MYDTAHKSKSEKRDIRAILEHLKRNLAGAEKTLSSTQWKSWFSNNGVKLFPMPLINKSKGFSGTKTLRFY